MKSNENKMKTYLTNVGSPSAPNNFLRSEVTIFWSTSLQ